MSVREVLFGAARLIELHGWCQIFRRNLVGHYCAYGAIMAVATGDPHDEGNALSCRAINHMKRTIRSQWIGEWNDAPRRTRTQVVAALRKAARTAPRAPRPR